MANALKRTVTKLAELLADMERFIHDTATDLPPTVKVVLIHPQFETIHRFLGGNGRNGRLLITALFEYWGVLSEPLLYISAYLKQHQAEYYRRLSAIRTDGDWESWMTFFLEGVASAAGDAEKNIIEVASLLAADRRRLLQSPMASPTSYRLFEMLLVMHRFTIEHVRQQLGTSFPTATAAVKVLVDLGVAVEMTGQKKNRSFSYQAYVEGSLRDR
jgi:Fic family protein